MLKDKTSSLKRDISFCNETNLRRYLKNKSSFSESDRRYLKYFIDNFSECWRLWNKVRWDAAMPSEGVKELKEYLGEKFIPYYDSSWELAKEWLSKKRYNRAMVEEFYRKTSNYIYNSIIFHYSGDRLDLKKYWLDLQKKYNINSVLDFGCGVGNDGLEMMNQGMKVYFSDFNSPTLKFLLWRIKKRRYTEDQFEIIDVVKLQRMHLNVDMFWTIDVIEHMKDPLDIFSCIGEKTRLVVYFTDCDDKAGGRHPFHFKVNKSQLEKEFRKRNYKKMPHEILDVWLLQ